MYIREFCVYASSACTRVLHVRELCVSDFTDSDTVFKSIREYTISGRVLAHFTKRFVIFIDFYIGKHYKKLRHLVKNTIQQLRYPMSMNG